MGAFFGRRHMPRARVRRRSQRRLPVATVPPVSGVRVHRRRPKMRSWRTSVNRRVDGHNSHRGLPWRAVPRMTSSEAKTPPTWPQKPSCLRSLFDDHAAFVCRNLRVLGVSEADLDDALQEVFLVVFQRLREYEERGRARAWLYSICIRITRAHHRKLKRRREQVVLGEADVAPATQLESVLDRESLLVGQRLLQQLPRAQREVFWLYEVEDVPMAEIARALDCPLQTAYSRLRKARGRVLDAVRLVET
jgi:RNA polymerase sigma-70 factor (ECF subfamily)